MIKENTYMSYNTDNSMGKKLRKVRKDNRLTQTEMADKIGMSLSAYNKAEKGRSFMRDSNIDRVAELFNVDVNWLIGKGEKGEENQKPNLVQGLAPVFIVEKTALAQNLNIHAIKQSTQMNQAIHIPGLDSKKNYLGVVIDDRNNEPKLPEGATAILEEIQEEDFISGKIYYIVIGGIVLVRNIVQIISGDDAGKLRLTQRNKEGEEIIKKSDVQSWYLINHVLVKL